MEMVAWLAGEPHTDEPLCACPVISSLVRAMNDALPDDRARTQLLRPLVPTFVNTRGTAADERRHGLMVVDATVRQFVPHLLAKQGKHSEASALRELGIVRGVESARKALRALEVWAPDQHAARWVLQRAIEGTPAHRFVAGAIQVAKRAGDRRAWELVAKLAASLAVSAAARLSQSDVTAYAATN